jgi:hypothetical protein
MRIFASDGYRVGGSTSVEVSTERRGSAAYGDQVVGV